MAEACSYNLAMAAIGHILAVGSGKGGVGKSTVALNLALALSEAGRKVGIIDADVFGPNIPLMVGLTRSKWGKSWMLAYNRAAYSPPPIEPVEAYGLKIMSSGFIVGEDQPLVWNSGMVRALALQFVNDVDWGDLDFLVVDLPPGSGDIQQVFIENVGATGAIVVVTPQYLAHLDVRKAVQMYRQAGLRVLGGVENMSGYVCRECGHREEIFPKVPEGRSVWSMGVEKLGEIPFVGALSGAGEVGPPLLVADPDSAPALVFREAAGRVVALVEAEKGT